MREVRGSRWPLAAMLALVLALGVAAVAAATGVLLMALPGVLIVALGYGLYVVAARRRCAADSSARRARPARRALP